MLRRIATFSFPIPLAALYVSVRTVARKVVQQQSPADGLDFFALVVVVVVAARTGQRKKRRKKMDRYL